MARNARALDARMRVHAVKQVKQSCATRKKRKKSERSGPHTSTYVSAYCYVCVLILLHVCPRTAIYSSSYCYICVFILLIYIYIYMYIYMYVCMCVCIYICICILYLYKYIYVYMWQFAGWLRRRQPQPSQRLSKAVKQ
jgi:hypothetical protein